MSYRKPGSDTMCLQAAQKPAKADKQVTRVPGAIRQMCSIRARERAKTVEQERERRRGKGYTAHVHHEMKMHARRLHRAYAHIQEARSTVSTVAVSTCELHSTQPRLASSHQGTRCENISVRHTW